MKPVQRLVIGADALRQTCTSYRLPEHSTECQAIDNSALDPESDDSPCVVVHDDQHPIRLQRDRFTTQQVDAPKTVLHMADERQPRGTSSRRRRRILCGESPPNHVLRNRCSESQIDLFCNLRTPHDGLRRFISTTARIKSAVGPFGPGLVFCFGENRNRYFRFTNAR
jgi:hypothetical protein